MIFACACLSENHSVGNAFGNKHVCSRCLEVIETVENARVVTRDSAFELPWGGPSNDPKASSILSHAVTLARNVAVSVDLDWAGRQASPSRSIKSSRGSYCPSVGSPALSTLRTNHNSGSPTELKPAR